MSTFKIYQKCRKGCVDKASIVRCFGIFTLLQIEQGILIKPAYKQRLVF
jgi:hypothetical protein